MYSAAVLDHFENPRNSGDLPEANVCVRLENPVCADVLELALLVSDGKIDSIRFKAKGCVPCVACASLLTEIANGTAIEDVHVTAKQLEEKIGGLPHASAHASQLAVDALRAATREAARLRLTGQHD